MERDDESGSSMNAALRILDLWDCSDDQKLQILGITQISPEQTELTAEQLERVSHVLNIHATLRTLFDNAANVYGFMGMHNNNLGFDGRTPLELIEGGSLEGLAAVAERVQSLIEGGW